MNKKIQRVLVIAAVTLFSLYSMSLETFAATRIGKNLYIKNNVTVVIDGKTITFQDPILNKSGSLLLPMRDFYESIGAKVTWNKAKQTAGATRNGNSVSLTINSSSAVVNGKKVSVSVPPLLYKNRTYIPLRFVTENLDGKVYWNQKAQKVEILLNKDGSPNTPVPNPVPIKDPYVLNINNKRVVMTEDIINSEYRTFIPVDYFYNYLENSTGKWMNDTQFELTIAGLSFVFTAGSNDVVINGETVYLKEKPFIKNGFMYIPVYFIVNQLGGNVRYLESKKEMYIYIHQYMFTSKFLEKSYGSTPVPQLVPSAQLNGNRSLLVSDNPETLTNTLIKENDATLAEQKVQTTNNKEEHRIFAWHFNTIGKKVTFGITIENTSMITPIEISDARFIEKRSGNSWIDYDIGLSIADAVFNGTMETSESKGVVIQPGETKTITSLTLYNRYILGLLEEIDVRSVTGQPMEYTIRTVLSKNDSDLNAIHSDAVPIDKKALHPRGVWPSSEILAELPTYSVGSPIAGFNISNGKTDHFLRADNSLSQTNGAVGNSGHFGMNYKVVVPIENNTGAEKEVAIKLAGRGGIYSGSVKVNGKVYLVPTIQLNEYIELPTIKAPAGMSKIELEFMHSGGSNLPLGVYVESK